MGDITTCILEKNHGETSFGFLISQPSGLIEDVAENSPAWRAGLKRGDVIIFLENESVSGKTIKDFGEIILRAKGGKLMVTLSRSSGTSTFVPGKTGKNEQGPIPLEMVEKAELQLHAPDESETPVSSSVPRPTEKCPQNTLYRCQVKRGPEVRFYGFRLTYYEPSKNGLHGLLQVSDVVPNSAAHQAGLENGMAVIKINGIDVANKTLVDVRPLLLAPGTEIEFVVATMDTLRAAIAVCEPDKNCLQTVFEAFQVAPMRRKVPDEPWLSDAFAIVGYFDGKLTPREKGARLAVGVELEDPNVLFLYTAKDSTDPDADRITQSIMGLIKMEFCQRDGYRTYKAPQLPVFNSITLTKMPEGTRTHAAVLTIFEGRNVERSVSFEQRIYVPKFIVLLSKLHMPDFFKQCLDIFYAKFFIEQAHTSYLNKAIAKLVHNLRVPVPGQIRRLDFGFGKSLAVPCLGPMSMQRTGHRVYRLFLQLGVENVVEAVQCLLNEMRLVVFSRDVTLVAECCEALIALLWPFPYNHVYAQIVGRRVFTTLLEACIVFCVGTTYLPEGYEDIFEKNEIALVDLDKKIVKIPTKIREFGQKSLENLRSDLGFVMNSDEFLGDLSDLGIDASRDRRIEMSFRACFLRLYASIFAKYRRSLSAVRFYREPKFYFDEEHFLSEHGLRVNDGSLNVEIMKSFFQHFLDERSLPYRQVDVFDELCAKGSESFPVSEIVQQLMEYETNSPVEAAPLFRNSVPWGNGDGTERSHKTFPLPDCLEIKEETEKASAELDSLNSGTEMALSTKRVPVDLANGNSQENRNLDKMSFYFFDAALNNFLKENTDGGKASNDRLLLSNILQYPLSIRRRFCTELSRRSLKNGRLNRENFEFLAKLVAQLVENDQGETAAFLLLQAVTNIYNQPSANKNPVYLHEKLNKQFDVWQNESFWLSWLAKFVASELGAHYSSNEKAEPADIYKEPGQSMTVLADVLAGQAISDDLKRKEEERRIVEACRLCIDLMLPILLHRYSAPNYDSFKNQEKLSSTKSGTFFSKFRRKSRSRSSSCCSATSISQDDRRFICDLVSSVISQFSALYGLDIEKRNQLLQSINQKLDIQGNIVSDF